MLTKQYKTSDFFYELPQNLIAQTPLENRDQSRMLRLSKSSGKINHSHFYEITDILKEGDCLLLNDSRVIPARLFGRRESDGIRVELLLLREIESKVWESLVKPGKKCKTGERFIFDGGLVCIVRDVTPEGNRIVEFDCADDFRTILDKIGVTPLPPYISQAIDDPQRYQTVYSKTPGSAAAPTAGLHFTDNTLAKLRANGVVTAYVTLHIGTGTFRPVKTDHINEHVMHSEYYELTQETANELNKAKARGSHIICAGTTSCRTLESCTNESGVVMPASGMTDIFIYPPYRFKACDALLTNFHLPSSTLIMLVCALGGYENVMNAYREAVKNEYRFFSFGDCMLII